VINDVIIVVVVKVVVTNDVRTRVIVVVIALSPLQIKKKEWEQNFEAQKTCEDVHKNRRHTNMGRMWT
jgi:hypothetical protein